MPTKVLQLYPPPQVELPLEGLYLKHRVHTLGTYEAPFVYANFVMSLDGRIALEETLDAQSYIPDNLTSDSDFRLFLELLAQADCLITHGGYLRALAERRLGNILQIGISPETSDLLKWRKAQGLNPQPAVVVASESLEFPIPESVNKHNQTIHIATGEASDTVRVQAWKRQGYDVILAGKGTKVEGRPLMKSLSRLGYRSVYLIAGPHMLETMVRDRQLSRLYLTITHQFLGGENFHSLMAGPPLGSGGKLRLISQYYDPASPGGTGQWFAQFEASK